MTEDDDAKSLILARRARFIAAALASAGLAAGSMAACGGGSEDDRTDQVGVGGGGHDAQAEPQVCLSPLPPDAGMPPDVATVDAGSETSEDVMMPSDANADSDDADGLPQPCLAPPP
jgi:hypothetical protein